MKFCDFLPVGSVVLLKNAKKRVVIIGLMPIKHSKSGVDIAYDYIGVPYPEGYIGQESVLLFNHNGIGEITFRGYSNEERRLLLETIQNLVNKTDEIVRKSNNGSS